MPVGFRKAMRMKNTYGYKKRKLSGKGNKRKITAGCACLKSLTGKSIAA